MAVAVQSDGLELRNPLDLRRAVGLAVLSALVADFVGYLVIAVPVEAPRLLPGQARHHWITAVVALFGVLAVDGLILLGVRRRMRARGPDETVAADPHSSGLPDALKLQLVPVRVLGVSAVASLVLLAGDIVLRLPIYIDALMMLAPWAPLFFVEARWRHEHYGFYAVFLTVTLLQVGHLGEHSAQVTQLLMTNGNLARSHGVFGQLDFETIHFVWDSAVWLGTGLLLTRYASNRWLWVSFVAASLHEIEHLYLIWVYWSHRAFYNLGGFAGIMGRGGLIGSPLYRPYLHFGYNYLVVVPMVIAFWDQSKKLPGAGTTARCKAYVPMKKATSAM